MSIQRSNAWVARRLAAALTVGGLILAVAGPAAARDYGHHGSRDEPRYNSVVQYEYYQHRGSHRKAHRRHKGHKRTVVINNYYRQPPPVVVERRVYVDRPVVVERRVIVERPVVVERPVHVERHYQPVYAPAQDTNRYHGSNQTITAGSLIGAAVGGLLGAQVGQGSGNLAATAAGTVGGFLLGDRMERRGQR